MLLREQLSSAAEPGLDFVEDQHHVVRGAEIAYLREIAGRGDDDAGLPLDRLDEEGDRVRRDRLLQRLGVAEGNDPEARRERPEMLTSRHVGAESDDTERASVKIVGADDDLGLPVRHALDLVTPLAHGLDRALYRLGTAVHWQHLVRAGKLCDLFVKGGKLVVVEGAGGQRQLTRLFHHSGQDLRMAVALVHRGICGEAIEITVALRIPQPDAFAARQNDAERLVVLGAKARFRRDEICHRWTHLSSLPFQRAAPTGFSNHARHDLGRQPARKACIPVDAEAGHVVGPYRSVSSADFPETRFQAARGLKASTKELHTTNVFVALSQLATPRSATPLYGS